MASENRTTPLLSDGVRRALEDAQDLAERNIEFLTRQVRQAEAEITRQREIISRTNDEIRSNKEALEQAKGMLGDV